MVNIIVDLHRISFISLLQRKRIVRDFDQQGRLAMIMKRIVLRLMDHNRMQQDGALSNGFYRQG